MAKKLDPQAKAKRQKTYAAVGGAILLALLAFQVPRTLKMLHQSDASAASSPPATTSTTATTPLAGTASAAASTAGASGGEGLTDPDAVPPPQSGQLLAFGRFRSKDPFVQQLGEGCSGDSACSTSSGSAAAAGPSGATGVAPRKASPASPSASSASWTPTKAKTAVISVNGARETVRVHAGFPAGDPVFTLVSLSPRAAKIAIAGGSLESGAPSVTLTKTRPLTLLNTADGTRYVLRLLSVS